MKIKIFKAILFLAIFSLVIYPEYLVKAQCPIPG